MSFSSTANSALSACGDTPDIGGHETTAQGFWREVGSTSEFGARSSYITARVITRTLDLLGSPPTTLQS